MAETTQYHQAADHRPRAYHPQTTVVSANTQPFPDYLHPAALPSAATDQADPAPEHCPIGGHVAPDR